MTTNAIEFLNACLASDNSYVYYADETHAWWLVSESDMADLAGRLERKEADAYSLWCAGSLARELCSVNDIRAFRDEAVDAGDTAAVLLCEAALRGDGDAIVAVSDMRDDAKANW